MTRSTTTACRLLAPLAAFALAACAAGPGRRPANPEEAVQARAVERWNLMIAGDFSTAYDYMSPGFRSTKSREAYAQSMIGRPVRWLTVAPYASECEPERCKVTVTLEIEVMIPGSMSTKVRAPSQIEEAWIRSDGDWYYVPDEIAKGGS